MNPSFPVKVEKNSHPRDNQTVGKWYDLPLVTMQDRKPLNAGRKPHGQKPQRQNPQETKANLTWVFCLWGFYPWGFCTWSFCPRPKATGVWRSRSTNRKIHFCLLNQRKSDCLYSPFSD